ncbi:Fibronectin leucine rich transmembrane protein [Seminavis robusta]|uniref:Fibronectin leucine rich transmembrane protein n=1 Tax=Seminavis robusta TaxID=568900 RepID=A0A9N8E3T2_9STRA|nr:Fibronectin leucine rich transmembrane protein [Seminavis robusta]|eukprot:Sro630_g178350.1 Fibronectin leucine rich transmembrane protein (529) ;mRNA; r:41989-43575
MEAREEGDYDPMAFLLLNNSGNSIELTNFTDRFSSHDQSNDGRAAELSFAQRSGMMSASTGATFVGWIRTRKNAVPVCVFLVVALIALVALSQRSPSVEWPQSTAKAIRVENTPQARGEAWLRGHPEYGAMPTWRKHQLMALATLYYATWMGSPGSNSRWLDGSIHECDWTVHNNNANRDKKPTCTSEGEYTSLEFLESGLQGTLPEEVSFLTKLTSLALQKMSIHGTIPRRFGALTALTNLQLERNRFTGEVPNFLFSNMPHLQVLRLETNAFSGTLSTEIGKLTALEKFSFSGNHNLKGHLPTELGFLTLLKELDLVRNSLSGQLPTELGLATALSILRLSHNPWTGRLPSELVRLSNLFSLDINDNLMTGTLSFAGSAWGHLNTLMLSGTHVSGTLPQEGWDKLTGLEFIHLSSNRLSGPLPSELGLLFSRLFKLELHMNQLTGQLPTELGLLTSVTRLSLHDNPLTGTIGSELGLMRNLWHLDLSKTSLSGLIPSEICSLPRLESVKVDCQLVKCNCEGTCRCQ